MDEITPIEIVPRTLLLAAGALILTTLIVVCFCRVSGLGGTRTDYATPTETRRLTFADRPDGGIDVRDNTNGTGWTLPRSSDGFVRVLLTSLMRDRRDAGQPPDAEVNINRTSSGAIWIEDPTTGRRVGIDAFGSGNAAAFSRLMLTKGVAQ